MEKNGNIFGCFFSVSFDANLNEEQHLNLANSFRPYIFGENGICETLKKLKKRDYGADLELALFQFYVRPMYAEIQQLKEIESYRKNEKAIGIPIIVDDHNFFNQSEEGRYNFLKESILQKMEPLEGVVKKRKLDTNMDLLKSDLKRVLDEFKPI